MLQLEHHALQITGSGTVIADPEGAIVYANPAFAGMVGIENSEELVEQSVLLFFVDHTAVEALMSQVMQSGETIVQEMGMRNRGGEDIFAQVSATCNRNADGNALGIVLSFADVTEHRRLQGELEQRFADQTAVYEQNAERLRHEITELKNSAREAPNG